MPAFIDKDPMSGLVTEVDDNHDDEIRHHFSQDVEPVLNHAKALRNDGITDSGIKRDMWHYAYLPPVVILKLKYEYNCDVFKREDQKKLFRLLNGEFKYLKTTELQHTVKH
jgi:hypothetical protein